MSAETIVPRVCVHRLTRFIPRVAGIRQMNRPAAGSGIHVTNVWVGAILSCELLATSC
jgi:hypothetical protein